MKIVGGGTELEGGGIYPRKGVCRPWRLRRVHETEWNPFTGSLMPGVINRGRGLK